MVPGHVPRIIPGTAVHVNDCPGPKMRAVESAPDPVSRFASRLLETPALRALAALQKEEQALNVLRINGPQLLPVFSSLGLDVKRGWREPAALVSRAIRAEADRMMGAEVERLLSSRLMLSFFPGLVGGRPAPGAREGRAARPHHPRGGPSCRAERPRRVAGRRPLRPHRQVYPAGLGAKEIHLRRNHAKCRGFPCPRRTLATSPASSCW